MFQHLLVPLDGSRLAEAALPAVECIARATNASVTLLHVVEKDSPPTVHGEHHLTRADEAETYLQSLTARLGGLGFPVSHHVHSVEVGDVARSIVDHAMELSPDLIVLSTHGRQGPWSWISGSIAQQVIARGKTPVLVVQPQEGEAPPFQCRSLLVTLDGNAEHEAGMEAAIGLAQACSASIHLVMAVETPQALSGTWISTWRLSPFATSEVLEMAHRGGNEYLGRQLERIRSLGLEVSAEVGRGRPVQVIRKISEEHKVDLVVMATHGTLGLSAFWAGSLAARFARASRIPMLLVPVQGG
jgi:nucleotide-binding universal stress UspA family protein